MIVTQENRDTFRIESYFIYTDTRYRIMTYKNAIIQVGFHSEKQAYRFMIKKDMI